MKNHLIIIFLIFIYACNQNSAEEDTSGAEKKLEISDTVQQFFDLPSHWVNTKYVRELLKTKSPREAQGAENLSMLMLPQKLGEEAFIIFNFHEGIPGILLECDEGYGIKQENAEEFELKFTVEGDILKTVNNSFQKISYSMDRNNFDIVEQLLFAGTYEYRGNEITFSWEGSISGLENFSYYNTLIDYYDVGLDVDQIELGWDSNNISRYGFKFSGDTLVIYQLDCLLMEVEQCMEVGFGEEAYRMVKRHEQN